MNKFTHQGEGGKNLTRHYCKSCKSPVYVYVEKYDMYCVYAGLLNDISNIKESRNVNFEKVYFPFLDIKEKKLET